MTELERLIAEQTKNVLFADINNQNIETVQVDTGEKRGDYSTESDYDRLHMQLPFLEINPVIGAVNALLIPTSGNSKTLTIPDGAQLMRLKSIQSFYMGWQNVQNISGDILDGSAPVLNPEGWYYCRNRSSVSILSTSNNQIITAEFFIQL